jgi:hypothetical protein
MILSLTLLTMASASTIQTSTLRSSLVISSRVCALPALAPLRRRPPKLWEQPIHDWEWDSVDITDPIPAKYLHLSGFGQQFEQHMTLKYQAHCPRVECRFHDDE